MDGCFFAFAPNDGFFYGTPKKHVWHNLDSAVAKFLSNKGSVQYLWAAFGPGGENFVATYKTPQGVVGRIYGDDSPPALKDWMKDSDSTEHMKVSLGHNGSFIAWDSKRIRWENIPKGLEKIIQGWLSPSGWTSGPPRIISLGAKDSFFALSEYGSVGYSIPGALPKTYAGFDKLEEKQKNGEFQWKELEIMSLSSCTPDSFIWFKTPMEYHGDIPEPMDPFCECIETLLPDDLARIAREARQKEAKEKEAKAKKEREAEAKRQREEEENSRKAQRDKEELELQYALWRSAWEERIAQKKLFTTFPHIPMKYCKCAQISCKANKEEVGSVRACRHDVEIFLRASATYSYAWLRKERLIWHPDKFTQRCDPDFRKELQQKATQLYQIYEILIEQERLEGRATSDSLGADLDPEGSRSRSRSPSAGAESSPNGNQQAKEKDLGRTATALRAYSGMYLKFSLGDIITNITFMDDKFWRGTLKGKTGIFPATYVKLVQA